MNTIAQTLSLILLKTLMACSNNQQQNNEQSVSPWQIDFFDDFDTFNPEHWKDQMIWVNNENHC